MKPLVIFIFLTLSALSACDLPKHAITKDSYKINREKTIDGRTVKIGLWTEAPAEGVVVLTNYRNGKKNGKVKTMYSSGEMIIANYKNDQRHGWERRYNSDGLVYIEFFYRYDSLIQRRSITPPFIP